MQFLALFPPAFFLLFYSQLYLPVLIVVLLFIYNLYRYTQSLSIIAYPLLLLLVSSFLLYSLYGLGNKVAPQTFEIFKEGNNSALFKFSEVKQIDKICYYTGIDNFSKFTLSYLDAQKLKEFYAYSHKYPFSFRWNCLNTDIKTSELQLHLSEGSLMLGEVRFMYNDLLYDDLIISMQSDKALLNDEPQAIADMSYFSSMFFDEIYHGRTAYEVIHGLKLYDNAHPNVGKLLIASGIKAFGMTPFGWRLTNVLFGTLFIVVFYYFSLILFDSERLAFAGALLLTYSFMHFTQARVALIDTFGVLFVFISYYFLYRFIIKQNLSPLLLSGLFFGLAAATKWAAVFASIGFLAIAVYLLVMRYPLEKVYSGYKLMFYGLLSYVVLALTVYVLTFYNIYLETGSLKPVYWQQFHIYNYHSNLQESHIYSSPWWSWPLNIKPMLYYREIKEGLLSSITVLGNPAIFLLGNIAILYLFYVLVRRVTLQAFIILSAFLALYLPYVFIDRVMFIYHFYYALPFMILAIVYLWKDLIAYSSRFYVGLYLFLIIVIALFLLFYPVLSGYKVPLSYTTDYLNWFKGWTF